MKLNDNKVSDNKNKVEITNNLKETHNKDGAENPNFCHFLYEHFPSDIKVTYQI
jgi:hypothetical protein